MPDPAYSEIVNQMAADTENRARAQERLRVWPATSQRIAGVLQEVADAANAVTGARGLMVFTPPTRVRVASAEIGRLGSVQLTFSACPLPIGEGWSDGQSGGVSRYFEDGATCLFAQGLDGRVGVIWYPFRIRLGSTDSSRADGDVKHVLQPDELTEAVVRDHATQFIQWALGTSYAGSCAEGHLGFKVPTLPPLREGPPA